MIFYNSEEFVRYVNAGGFPIIGVTSGCFDLLHPLHVEYLNKCKRDIPSGYELFVFIDSDRLVEQNKNKVPLINELDRAFMVDSLKAVNGVMVIDTLGEMFDCVIDLKSSDRLIHMFKNSIEIYGKQLIDFGESVVLTIIPDIKKFQSTSEIQNHLKLSKLTNG